MMPPWLLLVASLAMPSNLTLRYKRRSVAQSRERVDASGRYPRTHWCGCPVKDDFVSLVRTEHGAVLPSEVQYCKSVWTCPVCSGIIRASRGRDIADGFSYWHGLGFGAYFVTVTIRHSKRDPLKALLDTLSDAWRRVVSGSVWKRLRHDWQIEGYTRSLEVTYGVNGWHPHYHFIFFVRVPSSDETASVMRSVLFERFVRCLRAAGAAAGNVPNARYGLDVVRVNDDGRVLADYVSKISSIAVEMSASALKSGRLPSSFDAFQLLDLSTRWAVRAWREFCTAIKGKRSVYFSRGLREALGLSSELTDEEVVDDAVSGDHDVVGAVSVPLYNRVFASQDFSAFSSALRLAALGDWQAAAFALGSALSCVGDRVDGLVIPLLC